MLTIRQPKSLSVAKDWWTIY